MRSTRMRRTDDVVRRILSEALLTNVRDPRIGLVSVTDVRISKELDTARVFVSVLGDEDVRRKTLEGLRSAAPFLRSEIARESSLRRIPELRFLYDDSVDRGFRVDAALRDLARERDAAAEGAPDEGQEGTDDEPDR
jgi:ribosome-binding factor A